MSMLNPRSSSGEVPENSSATTTVLEEENVQITEDEESLVNLVMGVSWLVGLGRCLNNGMSPYILFVRICNECILEVKSSRPSHLFLEIEYCNIQIEILGWIWLGFIV